MTSKRIIAMLMAILMLFSGMAVSASATTGETGTGTGTSTAAPEFTKITLNATNCYVDIDNIEIVVENAKVTVGETEYDVIFTATQKDDATKTLRRLVDTEKNQTIFTGPTTGKTYKIQGYITIDGTDHVASNTFELEVLKAQAAPATPVPLKVTSSSITVKAVANCEYKLDDGEWVNTATFTTGVSPETKHTVYARYKYVAGQYYASEASSVTVTTLKAPKAKAAAPTLKDKTDNSIAVNAVEGVEYSINKGATWNKTGLFTNLKANTKYDIIARYTFDASVQDASPVSDIFSVVTNSKKNDIASKDDCKFEIISEGNIYAKRSFTFKVTGDAPKDYGSVQYGDTRLIPSTYTVRMNGTKIKENAALADDSKVNIKTGIVTPTEKGKVEVEVTYITEYFDGSNWENANENKTVVYDVESGAEYNAAREIFVAIANFFLNTLPNLILKFMGTAK